MSTILIYTLLLKSFLMMPTASPTLNDVRMMYHEASSNDNVCKSLVEILKPYNEKNNPVLSGYRAGATMMMAKYVFSPFTKISYFRKGRDMLQRAVNADDQNIELRFLRFAVQTNLPFFLGYKDHIDADKIFILKGLSSLQDPVLKANIGTFMKGSDYVSDNEKINLL
ncbi:MAG: hypothetical protein ABI784_08590 [Ginsengibacter sp.]